MEWEGIAAIAAILALIATVLIFIFSSMREARTRLIDNFNKMYQKTFALRTELNLISQSVSNEDFYYELDRILHCNSRQGFGLFNGNGRLFLPCNWPQGCLPVL